MQLELCEVFNEIKTLFDGSTVKLHLFIQDLALVYDAIAFQQMIACNLVRRRGRAQPPPNLPCPSWLEHSIYYLSSSM